MSFFLCKPPYKQIDIPSSYKMNLDEEVSKFTGDGGVVSMDEIHEEVDKTKKPAIKAAEVTHKATPTVEKA